MALRADEGRDKLRKAAGRSKYPVIRRCPNGETHLDRLQVSIRQSITYGREPGELKLIPIAIFISHMVPL